MADRGEDKRVHPRIPWVVRVDYPNRGDCLDATENLSAGGLFVQTDQDFQIGDEVPLALSFPGLLDPMRLSGRVAWIRPARGDERAGVGVRVERDEDRTKLQALIDAASREQPAGTLGATSPNGRGYRILIVEDNPHVADMYTYVLRRLATGELDGKIPLEMEFASDGHIALQKLQTQTFHLVLTDLYMPVLDGFELVERMKGDEKLKQTPVVVISAAGKDVELQALQLGVDIFLKKPVRFVEVLETVKRLLRIN